MSQIERHARQQAEQAKLAAQIEAARNRLAPKPCAVFVRNAFPQKLFNVGDFSPEVCIGYLGHRLNGDPLVSRAPRLRHSRNA